MGLKLNTIITLESTEQFVLISDTVYGGVKYFLAMGVDSKNEIVPTKVVIVEEIINGEDLYIDKVTDPEMIIILTRILKQNI